VFAEGERPLVFSERALEMAGDNFVGPTRAFPTRFPLF